MELSRKCFICENENSRLINYSTNMCGSSPVLQWYLVIGPMELENIIPGAVVCRKQRNLKHEVKFQSNSFCEISATVSTPKMSTFIEQAPICLASRFF